MNPVLSIDVLVPLLLVGGALVLWWSWRSADALSPRLRIALVALRACAVALVAVLALNPGRWQTPVRKTDSEWAVLLDRSASMQVADENGTSRWAAASALAARAHAADPARARLYPFGGQLEAGVEVAALAGLKPDAAATDYARAGLELLRRHEGGRGLAGVLLLSDGHPVAAAGDADELALRARGAGAPVHAIALGAAVAPCDLSVQPLRRQVYAFPSQQVRVPVRVTAAGLANAQPQVRLIDEAGREVASAQARPDGRGVADVTLTLSNAPPGFHLYRAEVAALPEERTRANNEARVGLASLGGRLNVLLVEGLPHWDTKFLAGWLRQQPHIALTTLHRLAPERFLRRDAGADVSGAEALFPAHAAELAAYDLVILGRGAEYFLDAERAELLQAFVRERGGGLLMARARPFYGSVPALAELEPVEWSEAPGGDLRLRPAPAAAELGLHAGLLPRAEDELWTRLPAVHAAGGIARLRPFAVALMEGVGAGDARTPLVATRRYGLGRVTMVNIDDLWRWNFFPRSAEAEQVYRAFWGELVQWMATQAEFLPGAGVALRLSATAAAAGEPVKATALRRDGGTEAPALALLDGSQEIQRIVPQPGASPKDGWSAVFQVARPGAYRVRATAGTNIVESLLQIDAPPAELDDPSADVAALARLCAASGGRLWNASQLDEAAAAFQQRAAEEAGPPVWRAHWDQPWVLLVLTAALAGEWYLRRRNGLM